MAKRKKRTSKSNSKVLTYIAWVLAVIALIMSSLVAGYYFGFSDAKEDALKKEKSQKQKRISLLKELEDSSSKKGSDSVNERLKKVLKKETNKKEVLSQKHKIYKGSSHEYNGDALANPPKRVKRDLKRLSTKPKLAIIIDDVCVRSHVEAIKAVGIPLTMSFLPPSSTRPNSAKLASKESFYMVHLPMEAMNFNKEEPFTLYASDSQRTISNRIKELKKLFPRVKYINNHTGSKFTSSEVAMNRLILALNDQHINFIDSRTTAETKAPKVMKNYGLNYVARDVFLDHRMDKAYIKSQIKKAIKIAKLHGSAIAIGHPHANTILALSESKKYFDEVELVYINRLY